MNSLRNKLIASVTMLAVAAIMLTSASFAWYTVSTQGDVAQVEVSMTAVDNVEIAVAGSKPSEVTTNDSGDQQTWGSTATYTGAYVLKQLAKLDGENIKTAVYGGDSRISGLENATVTNAEYSATGAVPTKYTDNKDNLCAVKYDFWIRTNNTDAVTISPDVSADGAGFKGVITVVLTDADSGNVLKTWSKGEHENYSFTPEMASDGYCVKHINVYVYVDGNSYNAKDLDSQSSELPAFKGNLMVTQA